MPGNILATLTEGELYDNKKGPGHVTEFGHGEGTFPNVARWTTNGNVGKTWDAGGFWALRKSLTAGGKGYLLSFVLRASNTNQGLAHISIVQSNEPWTHWYEGNLKIPNRWTSFRLHLISERDLAPKVNGFGFNAEYPNQTLELASLSLVPVDSIPPRVHSVTIGGAAASTYDELKPEE